MSLPIVEIEINQPLPDLQLTDDQPGFALVIRQDDRPIGFILQPTFTGKQIAASVLDQLIGESLGPKLLQEALRTELGWVALPPATYPSLSLAICTKDRPELLERCLNSILAGVAHHPAAVEILVIDNAPSDERTQRLVETFPTVSYYREAIPGLDIARNRALQEATGDYLAYLDDDVVIDRGWLTGFYDAWAENPAAAAFTGLVLPYELETEAQVLFEQAGGFQRGFDKIHYGQVLPGNPLYPCGAGIFGAGCNMAFRREVVQELGGFDPALDTGKSLPGGGDLDMFYRVIRAGHALVYAPQLLVFHQHRQTLAQLRRQYWSWGLGVMVFILKSFQSDPPQRLQHLRLIAWWFRYQLGRLKRSLQKRYPLPPMMILAELWGGLQGLSGGYGRSQARIKRLQQQFYEQPAPIQQSPSLSLGSSLKNI